MFKRQRQALKDFDAGLFKRLGYALSKKDGKALAVVNALIATGDLRQDFLADQQRERDGIAQRQKQTIRDAGREVTKAYKYDRDALRASHKAEDDQRRQEAKDRSKAIWEASETPQRDFEQATERTPPNVDQDKPQDRKRRSASEIMADKRKRSKGRTRSRSRRPGR